MQPFRLRNKPREGFRRRGHIVLAMLGMMIGVAIVPLAMMSWKLIDRNRETLSTEQQQLQVLLASSAAAEIDLHVEGIRSELGHVAQTLGAAIGRRREIPRDQIEQAIAGLTDLRMPYVRFSYFDGERVESIDSGVVTETLDPLFEETLRRAAEGYVQDGSPVDRRETTMLSDPFFVDRLEGSRIAIASPVGNGNTFRGVLTALVDLGRIWEITTRRNHTGHLLFSVSGGGTVVASSDPEKLAPGQDVSSWGIVKQFIEQGQLGARRSTPYELEIAGAAIRLVGTYEITQQGWGVFVQARDDDIYWIVGDMERTTLTWTAVLVCFASLAAIFFARTLSNPINRLAAASRALARGEFHERVEVNSSNEIGELAHTFNSMAGDIEEYIARLKDAARENNELFLGTISALAQAIDAKDPYTRGHSVRVNRYSMLIGEELDLPDAELRDLHVSSLLHDVGKIGIDDHILKKAGRLTDDEYETIKTHAALGATIMEPIPQMKPILPGLRHHHERCDGSGYPDGLKRAETPLMARIIAVADTYDAITTVRPYQQPMTDEAALARVAELRGPALDEAVVDAFFRAYRTGKVSVVQSGYSEVEPLPALAPLELDSVAMADRDLEPI